MFWKGRGERGKEGQMEGSFGNKEREKEGWIEGRKSTGKRKVDQML